MSTIQADRGGRVDILDSSKEWAHGLSKCDAEDLLDWLENQRASGQVRIENRSFAVRSPGFRAIRDADGHLRIYRRDEFHDCRSAFGAGSQGQKGE